MCVHRAFMCACVPIDVTAEWAAWCFNCPCLAYSTVKSLWNLGFHSLSVNFQVLHKTRVPEWCTGKPLLVHWVAIALLKTLCVCVCCVCVCMYCVYV